MVTKAFFVIFVSFVVQIFSAPSAVAALLVVLLDHSPRSVIAGSTEAARRAGR